ncbi:hypothetical protein AVEN_117641-1 [Araneus ventricosus]|uniref:Uncharacterized protein n=1 Tax=Araneus ventricosus TaxID=182803 RepID=A0A4Y2H1W3_ARAVE|nr:hypothetical protein AVEN_117641-1 [Araneus ventricosus]
MCAHVGFKSLIARLVEQWNSLTSILKADIHNNGSSSASGLRDYKIPKLNQSCLSSPRSEVGKERKIVPKEKTCSGERSSNTIASSASEDQKKKKIVFPKRKPAIQIKRIQIHLLHLNQRYQNLKK